jgi:protein tyrosine/serine phosphatase
VWHIAAIFEQLAGDDALPAPVHWTAGKDCTGIVIALVLGLVGVPYEVIGEDYALSAT